MPNQITEVKDYLEKHFWKPIETTIDPEPMIKLARNTPWDMIGRISVSDYCINDRVLKEEDANEKVKNKPKKNPGNAYLKGERSFFETVSPLKLLNPMRPVAVICLFARLAIPKIITAIVYPNSSPLNHTVSKPVAVVISLFSSPFSVTEAFIAPIASLDSIPKFLNQAKRVETKHAPQQKQNISSPPKQESQKNSTETNIYKKIGVTMLTKRIPISKENPEKTNKTTRILETEDQKNEKTTLVESGTSPSFGRRR